MKKEDNEVFVGKKPAQVYAISAMMVGKTNNVIFLKAMGGSIQRCVDASQLAVKRYMDGWKIGEVILDTVILDGENKEKKKIKKHVSTIEIKLVKK